MKEDGSLQGYQTCINTMGTDNHMDISPSYLDSGILPLIENHKIGRLKRYKKGDVLFLEGEPVKCSFVIKKGKVKIFCVSPEGRYYTYGIVGVGQIVGMNDTLLGGAYEATAEVRETTEAYLISHAELERLLEINSSILTALLKEQAGELRVVSQKLRDLSFLDVPQRLKHELLSLADTHGLITEKGIKIDLSLTNQEIADLISADRATVSGYLKGLKDQGYVWMEERHLVIVPPEHFRILDSMTKAVIAGDESNAEQLAYIADENGLDPFKSLNALTTGIRMVNEQYEKDKVTLLEVAASSFAMQSALAIIQAQMKRMGRAVVTHGTIIIGTVLGDIHDLGKAITSALLTSAGFEVVDLGVNVSEDQFVSAVIQHRASILAMSALMTTSSLEIRNVIRALENHDVRDKVKVMIGGAATSQQTANYAGADAYAQSAQEAPELALNLLGSTSHAEYSTHV